MFFHFSIFQAFHYFCASENQLLSGSQDKNQILLQQHDQKGEVLEMKLVDRFARGDGSLKALLQVAHRPLDNKIRVWMKPVQSSTYKLSATLPTARDIAINCMLRRNYVRVRRHKKCLWLQHSDTISSLAADGSLVFSCSWDRTVKVWRLSDLRCLTSFRAHDDAINTVAVSGDGFLYTGSAEDSTIKVWTKGSQFDKFALVSTLICHRSCVNALRIKPSGVLGDVGLNNPCVGEMPSGSRTSWSYEAGSVSERSPASCSLLGSKLLCSGSADASVRLWSWKSDQHQCLGVPGLGHIGPVKSITVAEEQKLGENQQNVFRVYNGGLDKQIIVRRIDSNKI